MKPKTTVVALADMKNHLAQFCFTAVGLLPAFRVAVQEEEEKRRLEAELREFDSRLERSERSKNTTY